MNAAPPTAPSRDFAPAARRVTATLAVIALLASTGWWAWQQPFMARARTLYEVARLPPPDALPVPVEGVAAERIADTWGAPRGIDRRHQGVDIFAPRGTVVRSTTRGVVVATASTPTAARSTPCPSCVQAPRPGKRRCADPSFTGRERQ